MKFRPIAAGALALGLALLAGLHAWRGGAPDTSAAPPPPAAPADFVLAHDAPQWRWLAVAPAELPGERLVAELPALVALDEDHSVRVVSPVAGRVVALDAKPGEHVAKGQALARLTSSDVGSAQSDLAKAAAAAEQSHAALERSRELYDHHVIALKDLEQARADEAQARAEAERARERVSSLGAGQNVDQAYVLRAPVAGEVLERNLNPGAEVQAGDANPLFVISDLRRVWLTASLYPRDLAAVHAGDRVRFTTDALPGRAFDARIAWVSDALDPNTRTATLRAEVANPDGALRAQMPGALRVFAAAPHASAGPGAVVPTSALVTHGAQTDVIVEVAAGRFRRRAVQVSSDDGVSATLLAGVRPGERVVTRGSLLLAGEMDRDRP